MGDDIHFNHIYALVKPWFDSEPEARRWYTSEIIPAYDMTPIQIVEQLGKDELVQWVEAKNLGCFG
jgi:hypothetical protein|tara:strand:- start:9533 stop:9730 length:198 start_codon:yes stop_codon:yes gene_type:complete